MAAVTRLGEAALALHDAGLAVMPLRARGKLPLLPTWRDLGQPDRSWVQGWWARWPAANIAVITGASRLVVIDLDGPEGGRSWGALTARHGTPRTRTARTGRGWHLYFAAGDGHVPNSAGSIAPGVDVRGTCPAYVVAPPSVHPSGSVYAWVDARPPAPLPDWLRALAAPPPPVVAALDASRLHAPTRYAWKALEGEVQRILDALEGTRNDTLARGAFRLGQLVASGALGRTDALSALDEAGRAVGLPELEVQATAAGCLEAGARHPRVAA